MFFFFQAEDGIRDLVRSRGLGDVYKRQALVGERVVAGIGAAVGGAGQGDGLAGADLLGGEGAGGA